MQSGTLSAESFSSRFSARFFVYLSFIRNAFLTMLAYRLRYFTGIITYLLFVSVHYFIWQAVFANQPDGAFINGFTLTEMVTYISVAWISRSLYFSNIDYDIDEMVRSGEIAIYLLRPVNFQLMMLAKAFGESIFRAFFFTVPVGIVITAVFPISLPASGYDFFLFCASTVMAFFILAQFNFIVGLSAFALKSITGLIQAKYYIVQICSGLLIPLAFFPDWAEQILRLLPFQTIASIPLQFYLGKIPDSEIASAFLLQLFWLVMLTILGKLLWQKALAKLTLQGG